MEKNPMASSPNLIEYFLIMGYEESYIQEKIIKNFSIQTQTELELAEQKNKKLNPESKILNEYKCRNLPSIRSANSARNHCPGKGCYISSHNRHIRNRHKQRI